ncbi:YjgN family protein [Sphingomonas sp. RS6]
MHSTTEERGAFAFLGSWREFAPIAFTNLLLTLVTLGIYSFWARTRERRYLWSRTRFIDDTLEWTGTGLELFIGYLIAMVVVFVPLAGLQWLMQALITRGHVLSAGLIGLSLYLALFYLVGIALFRALRYRLSRTFWHGIRGGSDAQGFRYGLSHMWRTIVGALALGLLVPWAMVSLWNRRWRAMSFGPYRFECDARASGLMGRYLLYYLAPIVLVIGGVFMAVLTGSVSAEAPPTQGAIALAVVLIYLLFFVVFGLIALHYYAGYFREVVGSLSLGDLEFEFTAGTGDWVKLMLGNIGLVIITLGIGAIFIGYRNWSFFVRHLRAYGTLDLATFTQSTTRAPGQGEGLFDAFDMGAL